MLSMPKETEKPKIGQAVKTMFADREITLYRMPSSSRAYPLALERKQKLIDSCLKILA